MKKTTHLTQSAEETISFAKSLASALKPGSCLALFGDLGSGKTTFCKGVIAELGSLNIDEITSPTFTYLQTYMTPHGIPIHHFDLYRLLSQEDFTALGFEELLYSDGICLIEWPDKVTSLLPKTTRKISFSYTSFEKRHIEVE